MARRTVDQMISDLIDREGSYVSHEADRGGATNFGITQAVARSYGYTGDMRSLPRGIAESIYRKQYFTDPGFDNVYLLSVAVAEELFDTGVNMGIKVPGPWLQRLLNAFNDRDPELQVDGRLGPATISSMRSFLQRRGADGEKVLVRGLNCLQGARYIEITEARPENKAFIYGWLLNRIS